MSPDALVPDRPEGSSGAVKLAASAGPVLEAREVKWAYSESLPAILAQTHSSLLFSTYETGHLVVVSAPNGKLTVSFHTFERPMGVAVRPGWLVVGTRTQIWSLPNFPDLAAKLRPHGSHDACFLTRFSHFTGNIQCHELAWVSTAPESLPVQGSSNLRDATQQNVAGEGMLELWIVNTLFSCLCAAKASYSFAPRWRPPFISALVPEDRCHLNGLAVAEGKPRYVTALAETDSARGWRPVKVNGGCVIDVLNNQTICRGLTMPHSPRLITSEAGEQLLLLHSGLGQLVTVDRANGQLQTIAELPGYTRGLAVLGNLAFVGLSRVRASSELEGVPVAARRQHLKSGCAVVDLQSGQLVANFDFVSGIDELFDVQILPGITAPFVSGPFADRGTGSPVWAVPS
jgi:uncharacterized protein (TIGR03032 family)